MKAHKEELRKWELTHVSLLERVKDHWKSAGEFKLSIRQGYGSMNYTVTWQAGNFGQAFAVHELRPLATWVVADVAVKAALECEVSGGVVTGVVEAGKSEPFFTLVDAIATVDPAQPADLLPVRRELLECIVQMAEEGALGNMWGDENPCEDDCDCIICGFQGVLDRHPGERQRLLGLLRSRDDGQRAQLLGVLQQRPGATVTKEELRQALLEATDFLEELSA